MTLRRLVVMVLFAIALAGCGSGAGNEPVEEAYKSMIDKRGELGSVEEKLALTKEFLTEYPQSDKTPSALYAVFYYQGLELGDKAGAVAYAESIRKTIDDPAIARSVDKRLIEFYAESGMIDSLVAVAEQLAAKDALGFDDHWNVIEGAVKARDWTLVREYCSKARSLATPGAIRAENPDDEFADDELARMADDRVGMLLVKDGWARSNQGQTGDALEDFARADKLVPRYYFDVPEYDLNVYWGSTLLTTGDYQAAIDRFAVSGLVLRNEESLAGLKKAYAGLYGSDDGYKGYADKLHRSIATTVDDFEMPDYDGNRHRFSDLRGEVTLLALWFPT